MPRRIALRLISILFAFNAVCLLLVALWLGGIMKVPSSVLDVAAPFLAISVLPLAFLELVTMTILNFLSLMNQSGTQIASGCLAIFSAVVSAGIWRTKRWALHTGAVCFGAAGALYAMSVGYSVLHTNGGWIAEGSGLGSLGSVLSGALIAAGMFSCIGVSVYLLRAARAEGGEYPAPELGLSLRGK